MGGGEIFISKNMNFWTVHPRRQNRSERITGEWWQPLFCCMKNSVENIWVVLILHLELLNTRVRVVNGWVWRRVCNVKLSLAKNMFF